MGSRLGWKSALVFISVCVLSRGRSVLFSVLNLVLQDHPHQWINQRGSVSLNNRNILKYQRKNKRNILQMESKLIISTLLVTLLLALINGQYRVSALHDFLAVNVLINSNCRC